MAASERNGIILNCRKTLEITLKKQFLKKCYTTCLRDVTE